MINGIHAPSHAKGFDRDTPKNPNGFDNIIAANDLMINSIIPATVGIKLCPNP